MSIVGPRPERPEIAAEYEKEMPEFRLRLQARAGLTGYAQVYGKYNAPLQTPYDIVYVGRLTYQKNPQRLINVLGSIVSQKPEVKCALIGTGDLEEEVKGLIKIKKLEKYV